MLGDHAEFRPGQWLTWCGYVLREAGSGIVYPYALAVSTTAGDPE